MDFPLITYDPDTGMATVGMPQNPRAVRGVDKLSAIVCVALLKNGGQDVFAPDQGSGIRALIGQYNYYDPSEIQAEVIQRVGLIEQQIIANQQGFTLPASEKLVKLRVLSVVVDNVTWNTAVRIQIINEAGQSIVTVV